ncbi:hypothetical protein, partial [Alistipes finegoldii]|uniref:hypothetical protein n=1 Tax=Alistipes finegoldii TaxID=214856 RepID=UPI0024958A4F
KPASSIRVCRYPQWFDLQYRFRFSMPEKGANAGTFATIRPPENTKQLTQDQLIENNRTGKNVTRV